MHYDDVEKNIANLVEISASSVLSDLGLANPFTDGLKAELELPKDKSHGDIATNAAMKLAKGARKSPLELAGLVADRMRRELSSQRWLETVERIEVKPPGFINFFLHRKHLHKVLLEIKRRKDNFGRSALGRGLKLQIEFVSANPTGPLTIAHGRQAAIGDSLAGILRFLGYNVTKEYYINDEGTQMDILASSISARYMELCGIDEEFPHDGYKGSYVYDIARDFKKKYRAKYTGSPDIAPFREFGLRWILNDIKKDLKDFGVKFDVWYSQKGLRKSGKIEETLAFLKEKGYIYEQEKARWFKSTLFGDDKDRVVVKSDGKLTYLAPDIAYHRDKYRKGYARIIDIWGPDHHGYVPRMKAAIKALGKSDESLDVLIVQLATLCRSGKVVSMSTRAGEFITLREVMDEIGKDVARFCFLMRRISSHLDFDLDVVKKESMENPVYYIQYAHARIWSILKYASSAKIGARFDSALLKEAEETELMRILRQFPHMVCLSAKTLEPYVILQYLQDLATAFHSFYNKHRVIGNDPDLTRSRLVLVDSVRIVLANGLSLLGVSLPKKM